MHALFHLTFLAHGLPWQQLAYIGHIRNLLLFLNIQYFTMLNTNPKKLAICEEVTFFIEKFSCV